MRPNLPCQAWTRAVKAKRGSGSNDKRAEAHGKVLTLLHAFSSFFDLCQLMEEDEETGPQLGPGSFGNSGTDHYPQACRPAPYLL